MADEEYTDEQAQPVEETPDESSDKKKELIKLWEAAQAQVQLPDGVQATPLPPITVEEATPKGKAPTLQKEPSTDVPDQPEHYPPVEPLPLEPPPTDKIRMLSTKSMPGKKFSPEVEAAIDQAAQKANVDPTWLRAIAAIESSGIPTSNINRGTQYKGLFQIGRDEWRRTGEGGDIYNARDNAIGMANLLNQNRKEFIRATGREPTPNELYLLHQQGLGFFTPGIKRGQTAAGITNPGGNMPPGAPGAAQSREAFLQGWSNVIARKMAERGTAPTARIAEADQPSSMLSPESLATTKVPIEGGIPDTPEAQAMIATLMRGGPMAAQGDPAKVAQEAAVEEAQRPRYKGQAVPRTATIPEKQQVQGAELPTPGVSQTPTMPIPGMGISGQQALLNAVWPSLQSTIQSYPATQPTPPPVAPPAQPWTERIMNAVKDVFAGTADPSIRTKAIADLLEKSPLPQNTVQDWLRSLSNPDIETNPNNPWYGLNQAASGLVGGITHMPTDLASMGVGLGAGAAGLLSDSDVLKTIAAKAPMWGEERRKEALQAVGLDPANLSPTAKGAETIGQNIGPSLPMSIFNLAMGTAGQHVLGPASQYLAEKLPIPNLNPISEAQAATVFGKPPLVVNTPGGPVVMNDAELGGFVWGGALAAGFGLGVSNAPKMISWARNSPWLRSFNDPRREVRGAPGTWAASIPEDYLKGSTLDRYGALGDIADRQTKYDSATHTGIDPVGAERVRQKWRVQTGAGADNLVNNALTKGQLNAEDFRFDVGVPLKAIGDFTDANPLFAQYLKIRMIEDELNYNAAQQRGLPTAAKKAAHPDTVPDGNGTVWDKAAVVRERRQMELDNPDFVTWHGHYQDNLAETRRFISDHQTNNIEDPKLLGVAAAERPTFPIFSESSNPRNLLDRTLAGDSPVRIAEDEMKGALSRQMKYDAEQHYMNIAPPDAFTPRTSKWVNGREGATARESGAVIRRKSNGETVYWTADPLVVSLMNTEHIPLANMDAYFTPARFKSWFQASTTGLFAPWFAPTGGLRAMEQGWTTAPGGVRSASGMRILPAGPISTVAAIGQQIGPRVANWMVPKVDWFASQIRRTMPAMNPSYVDLMARTLEKAYKDSFLKRMQDAGAYSGDTLQQAKEIHQSITTAKIQNTNPQMQPVHNFMANASEIWQRFAWNPTKAVGRGIKGTGKAINEGLRAVQEAPNFAWAYKTGKTATETERPTIKGRPISDAELAMRMRDYTGDPSTRGFMYTMENGRKTALRYEGPGQWRIPAYKAVGAITDTARSHIPWAGVLIQSPASTLRALRENPVRANLAFTASAVMPEVVAYLWNSYHSDDKNDYVNYMMNGRSDYNLMNNTYWATPGQPPQNGVEFRQYQETIMMRYMARAFMHQYNGKSMNTFGQDTWKALMGFLKGAVIPPQPSYVTMMLGAQGVVTPEGWMGPAYLKRNNEYIELGGGDNWLELMYRAVSPAISDITLSAATAGMNAQPGDVTGAMLRQVGQRMAARTAIVGDILGYKPSVAGSTELSEEAWKNKHIIDDMMYRYKAWDIGQGAVNFKGKSKAGSKFVQEWMPENPPVDKEGKVVNPGMQQPDPKNPLYKMLMQQMEETFRKDDPKKGGIGFQSMWKDYAAYGTLSNRMRTVNEGNAGVWRAEQDKKPKMVEFLQKNNVDPYNYKDVKDFFNARRNEAVQKILLTIKATEQKIDQDPRVRQMLGPDKHFSVTMLDPRKPGLQTDEEANTMDEKP